MAKKKATKKVVKEEATEEVVEEVKEKETEEVWKMGQTAPVEITKEKKAEKEKKEPVVYGA